MRPLLQGSKRGSHIAPGKQKRISSWRRVRRSLHARGSPWSWNHSGRVLDGAGCRRVRRSKGSRLHAISNGKTKNKPSAFCENKLKKFAPTSSPPWGSPTNRRAVKRPVVETGAHRNAGFGCGCREGPIESMSTKVGRHRRVRRSIPVLFPVH